MQQPVSHDVDHVIQPYRGRPRDTPANINMSLLALTNKTEGQHSLGINVLVA